MKRLTAAPLGIFLEKYSDPGEMTMAATKARCMDRGFRQAISVLRSALRDCFRPASGRIILVLGMLLSAVLPAAVLAQPAGEADPGPSVAPAVDLPDDVMTPTRNGFRITPELARLMARRWLQVEIGKDVSLNESQEEQLAGRVAERFSGIIRQNDARLQELVESSIESLLASRGRPLDAERSRRFAEQAGDLLPVIREFLKDFARDARPLLADDQWSQLKERLRRDFKRVDRAEEIMKRWAAGGASEGEDLMEELARIEADEELGEEGRQKRQAVRDLQRARRRADFEMAGISPRRWHQYVPNTAEFFGFDEQQRARAAELVGEHIAEAEKIMDPAWRERCRQNRIKYHLRWLLGREAAGPWAFHLEREYGEMMAPIQAIESRLCEALIALATPGQKDQAAEKIRQRAAEHGMPFDQRDAIVLGLR